MTGSWKGWVLCSLAAAGIAVALTWGMWRVVPVFELALGLMLAISNALAATLINRVAMVQAARKKPLWGTMANIFRIFVLLAILVLVLSFMDSLRFDFFLVAMLSGYFVFLFSEVMRLHKSTIQDQRDNE